jgi:hypothetical protein
LPYLPLFVRYNIISFCCFLCHASPFFKVQNNTFLLFPWPLLFLLSLSLLTTFSVLDSVLNHYNLP